MDVTYMIFKPNLALKLTGIKVPYIKIVRPILVFGCEAWKLEEVTFKTCFVHFFFQT